MLSLWGLPAERPGDSGRRARRRAMPEPEWLRLKSSYVLRREGQGRREILLAGIGRRKHTSPCQAIPVQFAYNRVILAARGEDVDSTRQQSISHYTVSMRTLAIILLAAAST